MPTAAQYREIIKAGLCGRCFKPRGEGRTDRLCQACAKAHIDYRHRITAERRCHSCRDPLGEGASKTLCAPCRKVSAIKDRERRARLISIGRCVQCAGINDQPGRHKCSACQKKYGERYGWSYQIALRRKRWLAEFIVAAKAERVSDKQVQAIKRRLGAA